MFLYEAFLYLHDALTECSLSFFHTEITEIHRLLRIASLALGVRTLNPHLSTILPTDHGTFRSLAKGKSKSRRERITSLALVGLAECFQPDGYIQAIAMYASAKVCVFCVRPKTFICVKPSLTECSLSFFHTEITEIHRLLRIASLALCLRMMVFFRHKNKRTQIGMSDEIICTYVLLSKD